MATLTASLATSGAQARAVHAGVNAVSGQYSATAALSASGSALVLLCKLPAGAVIHDMYEYHSTGASTQVLNFGIRHGGSASMSVQALLSAVTQAQVNRAGVNLPYTLTVEETANESFKYVVASKVSGSATTSLQINFTIFYSLDQ